ncbi:putative transcriptional regulator, TetR family [Candidatus Moduliflexus flocculans]|uniref:Putative transcriptional regulator, TetR family n=1 Tax=Candidatus Moduliflexus flocculans TaxID=1499966 RepID=A0A081BQX9_9BACT|nr:putative transcriptional regulator, TetR family [Candidatus Moduliflexus flocculans]
MPPQINFSKEIVLNEAFELVRQEGFQAMTARRIAQRLNCSTQPIYSAFASMKELEDAVLEKATNHIVQYLLQEEQTPYPFLNIGLRYLQFAREEKELFKLLYLSGKGELIPQEVEPFIAKFTQRMKQETYLQGLEEVRFTRMFMSMWIFTHGLIMLSFTQTDEDAAATAAFAKQQLLHMGRTVIEWEFLDQQRRVDSRLNDCGVPNLEEQAPQIS